MSAVLNAPPVAKFTPDDLFRLPAWREGLRTRRWRTPGAQNEFFSTCVGDRDGSIRLFRWNEELTAPVLPEFRDPVGKLFRLPGS